MTRPATNALRLTVLLVAVGSLLVACSDDASGTLRVTGAELDRPALPGQGALRLVVDNGTGTADVLVSVSSPRATSAMVHRSGVDGEGRATMDMVETLTIPARSKVAFEPGGLHVMLTGLPHDLAVGDEVPVSFEFERAGTVKVDAVVTDPSGGGDDHG